jgi:hypothetical protein
MTRANRNFGEDDPTFRGPGLEAFSPGGDDFGVVRIIDGHNPTATGEEGSNVHQPSAGSPMWDDPVSQESPDSFGPGDD